MIKSYQKFELNGLKIEANYAEHVKPCKVIKFTIDGKEATIDKHDLYALLMLYADQEEMMEAVKLTEKKVKMIQKAVTVTLKKDLKAGEDCTFIIEFPVDEDVADKWYEKNKNFISMEEAKKMLIK